MNYLGEFDVAVIGAGHAGIEAAMASAKRGCKTALFTISLDQVGNMPCNPSIGGSAKGQLVREIDALGGVMAEAADACCIQMRMLNLSKGASVHSPRAQEDRRAYQQYMKKKCESTPNLHLIQTEIADIRVDENRCVVGVVNALGGVYRCKAAVICAGTFLRGKVFIGQNEMESGPDSCLPARHLSSHLAELGIQLRRFKTGTPCRVHRRSIDLSKLIPQAGDENPLPFSFFPVNTLRNDALCYIANTNPKTHAVIHEHLGESPLYGGMIEGVGPRYCPSIEDKVVRFSQRERHQIFVEPTGMDTDEMYLQGLSTSLPEYVQCKILRSIEGLENVEIMRSAYAIEYDCINPKCLYATLAFRDFHGLYAAGQFNGTSGYEEAAAQGLVAGINASAHVFGDDELILSRESSYIGTLIDDLVNKGCEDPYRMMTARSEYRLSLRHGNADRRLTPIGYQYGLIDASKYALFQQKMEHIAAEVERISGLTVSPAPKVNSYLEAMGTTPLSAGIRMDALIRRPQVAYSSLVKVLGIESNVTAEEAEEINLIVKYQQYIERQNAQNAHLRHLEKVRLPENINYASISTLSSEAREKLSKVMPLNLRQASLISGVSPADINILLTWLKVGENNGGI